MNLVPAAAAVASSDGSNSLGEGKSDISMPIEQKMNK
jgi:hypothetical protein